MKRRPAALAAATALAGAGAAAFFAFGGSSSAQPQAADAGLETFLAVTADHMCGVQSTVYTDAAALAEAYAATPEYPGLAPSQVASFQQQLKTDVDISTRLTERIAATCR